MRRCATALLAVAALGLAVRTTPAAKKEWADIPAEERALSAVPFAPGATAVVTLSEGSLVISPRPPYRLDLHERIKILKDEGKGHGTISIESGDYLRMKDLRARTVLPDGTEVPLPPDAKFEKDYSDYYGVEVTSLAMPGVVPGAIVEYRYSLYFDTIWFMFPWYFQGELPVLESRFVYEIPSVFGFSYHYSGPAELRSEPDLSRQGASTRLTYTLRSIPPLADEPLSAPFADRAAQVVFIPTQYQRETLMKDWESVVAWFQGDNSRGYRHLRQDDARARREALEAAGGAADARARVEAVYRRVRDGVESEPYDGPWWDDLSVDEALAAGKTSQIYKALILQSMLKAVGIESSLGWTTPRSIRTVNKAVPNPNQFEAQLVVAEIDGGRVFLDPSARALPFGTVRSSLEGAACLLVDRQPLEWTTVPETPPSYSTRHARVTLELDAEGRLKGKGALSLTGHHARAWRDSSESVEDGRRRWKEWLARRYPGHDIEVGEIKDDPAAGTIEMSWSMAQRPEEVIEGESSVSLSAPLAVGNNPFTLSPVQRTSPVLLAFPDSDVLDLTLTWPEGWSPASEPRLRRLTNRAGRLVNDLKLDAGARSLTLKRQMDTIRREFSGPLYQHIQALYEYASTSDAENLVLGRE